MSKFQLNWKIVILLSVAIVSTLLYIVWNDYQKHKPAPVVQEEIYPKALEAKVEYKTDTKYASSLQRRIKELETERSAQNTKYEKLIVMYQQVLNQLDRYKDFFTRLSTEQCVANWETGEFYSYSQGDVQCTFIRATQEIKKEFQSFKEYAEDRMS